MQSKIINKNSTAPLKRLRQSRIIIMKKIRSTQLPAAQVSFSPVHPPPSSPSLQFPSFSTSLHSRSLIIRISSALLLNFVQGWCQREQGSRATNLEYKKRGNMDYYELIARSSFHDSLKVLEADVQYANALASSLPRSKSSLHMKLDYSHFAPVFLFLLHWVDTTCSCLFTSYLNLFHIVVHKPDGRPSVSSCARKATIGEFYSVILPSLQRLHSDLSDIDIAREGYNSGKAAGERLDDKRKFPDMDLERENECGICLEPGTKMVLPNCCHEMCIKCYHDWNNRSESCPFCRGSLRRVNSEDLWVLTCSSDVVETQTVLKEDVLRFYLYINALPKDIPDALSLMHCEYLV